jgi:hypothetical protein
VRGFGGSGWKWFGIKERKWKGDVTQKRPSQAGVRVVTSGSVRGGPFYVIDDEDLDRAFGRLQFQAELVERGGDAWRVAGSGFACICRHGGSSEADHEARGFDIDIEETLETGAIDDGAVRGVLKPGREVRHVNRLAMEAGRGTQGEVVAGDFESGDLLGFDKSHRYNVAQRLSTTHWQLTRNRNVP